MSDSGNKTDADSKASAPELTACELTSRRKYFAAALWLAIVAAAIVGYAKYIRWMWYGWFPQWDQWSADLWTRLTDGESYYTHGPLVPVICLGVFYLLVKKTRIEIKPNPWWGLAVLLLGQGLYLLASLEKIRFVLGAFALISMCGVILMLWGAKALRRFWFIPVFSIFAMPMGDTLFAKVSFVLRMLATDTAVWLADTLGVMCDRMGNTIVLTGDKELIVGDVCSGLRTLISLLAFGTIYAYICRLRGWLRWLLFSAIVPVGLICNSIRIAAIIMVAHYGTVEFAAGSFHDSTGVLIFVIAFLIMFGLEKLILVIADAIGRPIKVQPLMSEYRLGEDEKPQWMQLFAQAASWRGVLAAVVLIVTASAGWHLARRPLVSWDRNVVNASVPQKIEINGAEYHGRSLHLDAQVLKILNTSDYFYRQYISSGRPAVSVLVVYSQDNRVSTHAPEVCITAAGAKIIDQKTVDVEVEGMGTVACRALMTQEGSYYSCYLYTLRAGGSYTPSIWKQQAIISFNGLIGHDASGALIRVSAPSLTNDFDSSMQLLTGALSQTLMPLDEAMDSGRQTVE